MNRTYTHILFDLDGTLIDHFAAIHEAYRSAQETLGLPPASFEKVKATVGGSVPVTMRRLIGPDEPEERVAEALELFDKRFAEVMYEQVAILPGVVELLEDLAAQRIPASVFTNKKGEHARSVLEYLGLTRWFRAIVGAGDTAYRKPQPEFTDHILAVVDSEPAGTLLIGDSPFDVEAGKVRELAVAAVASGSHTEEQLRKTAADWVYPGMTALGEDLFGVEREACPSGN